MSKQAARKVPGLRFPGFEGEWSPEKLGSVASFSNGKGISKNDIAEDGETECIRYGELYTQYQEVITTIKSRTNLPKEELVFSKENDIIIPSSGESAMDIATASCVLKNDVALGGDLNIIRTKHNGVFLSFYFNNQKRIEIAAMAQGVSVVHLYSNQLKTLELRLPTLPEQQKIATFLTAVDTKLQQLARKKALLEQYKKGVMQQLFSQQLRFKGENGEEFPAWEEKTLGEISKNVMYGMNSSAIEFDGANKYLRITDIDENSREFRPNPLTSPDGEIEEKYKLKKGDIVFTRTGASVGKSYLYREEDGNLLFAGFLIKFSIIDGDTYFVYCQTLTQEYDKWVQVMSMRSGQPGINAEEYKSFKIAFPSLPEQQKIAAYLTALDGRIGRVGGQLAGLRAWKKGLLQGMFV